MVVATIGFHRNAWGFSWENDSESANNGSAGLAPTIEEVREGRRGEEKITVGAESLCKERVVSRAFRNIDFPAIFMPHTMRLCGSIDRSPHSGTSGCCSCLPAEHRQCSRSRESGCEYPSGTRHRVRLRERCEGNQSAWQMSWARPCPFKENALLFAASQPRFQLANRVTSEGFVTCDNPMSGWTREPLDEAKGILFSWSLRKQGGCLRERQAA